MAKLSEQQGRERPVCLREGLIYILESAPYSQGICLSFSVNTDSELSLLWNTLQSFTHRLLHNFFLQHVCCWKPMSESIHTNMMCKLHDW